ncbi:protein of unknown function [Methylocaldum szegediense]|uniref:Uncharacterized protein n=1 Tax=Methylocaldum szegediense TaxID=73780 RepID=A0ABM9HYF0_9GAMM|nr:protein of unknown function [Methylocaldum szegediense]
MPATTLRHPRRSCPTRLAPPRDLRKNALQGNPERQQAYYAEHAAEIQAKRRPRLNALSIEQREHWLERMRYYG